MNKRVDINDLDIPADDIDCWHRYPKYRWVYDISRLLDSQNIKWTPFNDTELGHKIPAMHFDTTKHVEYEPAYIYINQRHEELVVSEVYIIKGEIRHIRHFNATTMQQMSEDIGNVELRISAFASIHFQKFTGVISTRTFGNDIYSILLRPMSEFGLETNADIAKLIKRIYKKNDLSHVSGLTDHTLHESTAS